MSFIFIITAVDLARNYYHVVFFHVIIIKPCY